MIPHSINHHESRLHICVHSNIAIKNLISLLSSCLSPSNDEGIFKRISRLNRHSSFVFEYVTCHCWTWEILILHLNWWSWVFGDALRILKSSSAIKGSTRTTKTAKNGADEEKWSSVWLTNATIKMMHSSKDGLLSGQQRIDNLYGAFELNSGTKSGRNRFAKNGEKSEMIFLFWNDCLLILNTRTEGNWQISLNALSILIFSIELPWSNGNPKRLNGNHWGSWPETLWLAAYFRRIPEFC